MLEYQNLQKKIKIKFFDRSFLEEIFADFNSLPKLNIFIPDPESLLIIHM